MTTPLLATTLIRADHVRSFLVHPARPGGWEAYERDDQGIVQRQQHADWHRVEQTLARFTRAIAEPREQGWRVA